MRTRVLWQSCVVAAMGCVANGVALAQSTYDCSGVTDDKARLRCYDEEAARQKRANAPSAATSSATTAPSAASASTTAPPPVATTSPPLATKAVPAAPAASSGTASSAPTSAPAAAATAASPAAASSDFGLSAETVRKRQAAADPSAPKEAEAIVARVKTVQTRARGEYRITLDDGQVWDETQHTSDAQPPQVGETVTIKRGMLGSYFLSHSAGLALRVKRIN
jgi:hypothetical protein